MRPYKPLANIADNQNKARPAFYKPRRAPTQEGSIIGPISASRGSFETDPQKTRLLWLLVSTTHPVRTMSKEVASTSGRRSAPTTSTALRDMQQPGQPGFETAVLAPRGIDISTATLSCHNAFQHFNTTPPDASAPRTTHYQAVAGLRNIPDTMWLAAGDPNTAKRIVADYALLHRDKYPPEEWAATAQEQLLKTAGLQPRTAEQAAVAPMRLLGQSFQPDRDGEPSALQQPISGAASTRSSSSSREPAARPASLLKADLTLSVSYHLAAGCLGAASGLSASQLANYAPLRHRRACFPYLVAHITGCDSVASLQRSRHLLAAAGAVELFGRSPTAATLYGLVLGGVRFEIWELAPKCVDEWRGSSSRKVANGVLDEEEDVGALMDWLNEIHRWGNTVHANACAQAIRVLCCSEDRSRRVEGGGRAE